MMIYVCFSISTAIGYNCMRFCEHLRKVWLSVGAREVSMPSLESSGGSELFYSFGRDILKHPCLKISFVFAISVLARVKAFG